MGKCVKKFVKNDWICQTIGLRWINYRRISDIRNEHEEFIKEAFLRLSINNLVKAFIDVKDSRGYQTKTATVNV